MDKPAILGGKPAFDNPVPITKPLLPSYFSLEENAKSMFSSGMITNSTLVKQFEESARNYLGSKHCVALSSCTSGLMLSQKALNLTGEVILPSFTFFATGHSILWNNLKPVFVDIDPKSYQINPEKVNEAITEKTSAILAVHIFGNPAPALELEKIASDNNLKLIFDSAHAFGAKIGNQNVGTFGDVEVFSCSPTKLMITGEGGVCSTNNEELQRKLSIGRNYGDGGNYDPDFLGLNARMSEFNAALGIESIKLIENNIERRKEISEIYQKELSKLPGISFQKVLPNNKVTYKDSAILINPIEFGINRDQLSEALLKENIITKKYFYPPLHLQKVFKEFSNYDEKLPVTKFISKNILSIPLFSKMSDYDVFKVIESFKKIHEYRNELSST
ncbi:DegT/DnrJ/EryC1/StrS family aminotransferase [Nanoarchaeota archaeon]